MQHPLHHSHLYNLVDSSCRFKYMHVIKLLAAWKVLTCCHTHARSSSERLVRRSVPVWLPCQTRNRNVPNSLRCIQPSAALVATSSPFAMGSKNIRNGHGPPAAWRDTILAMTSCTTLNLSGSRADYDCVTSNRYSQSRHTITRIQQTLVTDVCFGLQKTSNLTAHADRRDVCVDL